MVFGGITLISAALPVYQQAVETEPEVLSFSSGAEASKYLIDLYKPDLIAIGEFHKTDRGEYLSATTRFAEILPTLRKALFLDYMLEFIPTTPDTKKELDYFKKTGELTPQNTPSLQAWHIQGEDRQGTERVYQALKGTNLYGVNINCPNPMECLPLDPYINGPIIKANMIETANRLLRQGKKVVIYGGLAHNDLYPEPADKEDAIVPHITKGHRVLELDIVVPEVFRIYSADFTYKRLYQKYVPQKGVSLIKRGKGSYVMLFPYSFTGTLPQK